MPIFWIRYKALLPHSDHCGMLCCCWLQPGSLLFLDKHDAAKTEHESSIKNVSEWQHQATNAVKYCQNNDGGKNSYFGAIRSSLVHLSNLDNGYVHT